MLERHIVPVVDCDLAAYHRPGSSSKGHIIFIMELVVVVRCGLTSMMPLKDLTSTLSMLEDRVNHLMKVGLPDLKVLFKMMLFCPISSWIR